MADPLEWLRGDDTGVSSKTIWAVMTGLPLYDLRPSIPWDPADFGRCYRLLRTFPAWEARLSEVAEVHPEWGPLVAAWPRLKALYEQESPTDRCPLLYDLMKALRPV